MKAHRKVLLHEYGPFHWIFDEQWILFLIDPKDFHLQTKSSKDCLSSFPTQYEKVLWRHKLHRIDTHWDEV